MSSGLILRNLSTQLPKNVSKLAELSTNFSTTSSSLGIQNVTVLGSGLMGSGIAQVTAQSGVNVNLVDISQNALDKAKDSIAQSLQRVAKKQYKDDTSKSQAFVSQSLSFINFTENRDSVVTKTDLVIEAIVENLDVKRKVFGEIDKLAVKDTIFASNTSSIPIKEIASSVTNERKTRFGGLHFFSPVPVMKLLEIVRIPETSEETFEIMKTFGKTIGKATVNCKDTPGFIVNRLLIPYKLDAMRMLERGDATVEDIDIAMKLGTGYPMGPFELSDFTGLDLSLFILDGWEKRFPNDPQFKVPSVLKTKVAEGKLGRKSGEGWYKYNK